MFVNDDDDDNCEKRHVFDSMDEWNSWLLAIPVPDFCLSFARHFSPSRLVASAAMLTLL